MVVLENKVQKVYFDANFIYIEIGGQTIKRNLSSLSAKLKDATTQQRNAFKISPSGYGIHWYLIDEDLSIAAMLKE